jgi:TonB family protein
MMAGHLPCASRWVTRSPTKRRPVSMRGLTHGGTLWAVFALILVGCGREAKVEDPTPLYGEVPIEYPLELWDADLEGQTTLRVRVTEMGVVDSVEVFESSGFPAFDSAAVQGASQLRYSPATRNGRRISVWAKVPVQFVKPGG